MDEVATRPTLAEGTHWGVPQRRNDSTFGGEVRWTTWMQSSAADVRHSRGAMLMMLVGVAVLGESRPVAWPFRAKVTDLHGQPVEFRAVTLGGDLIVRVGERSIPSRPLVTVPVGRRLATGDTLRATTPADFPLDLANGPVVFFSNDSIRVVVGGNPDGMINPVVGQGRRLTVRLAAGWVEIER